MKKTLSLLLACVMLVTLLAACTVAPISTTPSTPSTSTKVDEPSTPATPAKTEPAKKADPTAAPKAEEPKEITVEIFDRGNTGGSAPEDNYYTDYIKRGMLRDHNVKVTFVPVPRWTEVDVLNNLLAAGDAPDICVTYSYPTIQTYANMGGVTDLAPYLESMKPQLTNMWDLLGDMNIYNNRDPITGTVWAIEAIRYTNARINTFVREDWLKMLNIQEPTNLQEFETMLKAFKDNASTLLGKDAGKMIPFSTSFDVGWRTNNLLMSFVPSATSEKDYYVYGFDDRQLQFPGIKEGVRKLNEWYNAGLMWKDFALYGAGDTTEDNLIKAGYVGAIIHNWDVPYTGGEQGIHNNLQTLVGPDAAYISIDPFKNDAGKYTKVLYSTLDRKVFFPSTNNEPEASMLYVDWISDFDHRNFLQIGEEGVTHVRYEDGSVKALTSRDDKIMNSGNNIDYTITINGLDMGDKATSAKSIANGYALVDKRFIERSYAAGLNDGIVFKNFNVGEIKSEEGMGQALKDKRDALFAQAIVCTTDRFDAVWDAGYQDYLNSGAKAIQEERKAAYEKFYE
ncbi:MAG: extracellular solute-binding protein [Thermoclostridium sp.]|nr:extracellular solute-binding protein [Thermoclostridium sp.]